MSQKKSLMEAIESDGMTGLVSGAIAVAGSALIYEIPIMENIPVFGVDLPMGLVIGGSVALSVSTMKFVHDELIDKIPALEGVSNIVGRFGPPIVAGATTYGIFRLGVSSDASVTNSIMLGSLSAIAGDYVSESYFQKYV